MVILDPDSLHIVLRFEYRNCKVEIDQRVQDGQVFYVTWIHHPGGCAIATSSAPTKTVAIRRAKDWIEQQAD